MQLKLNEREHAIVTDSVVVTRTLLALSSDSKSVVTAVDGSEALIALARILLDRAEEVRAAEDAIGTRITRLSQGA